MSKAKRDQPLAVLIEDDQVVIRVGIDTLKFATEYCQRFYDYDRHGAHDGPFVTVEDKRELARDFIRQLLKEKKDGSTRLSDLFDDCIKAAFEDGSIGFSETAYFIPPKSSESNDP